MSKIAISLEQASILVLGDRLLLTFRCPVVSLNRDELAAILQTTQTQNAEVTSPGNKVRRTRVHAHESPFASDDSGLRIIYEEMRQRIRARTADTAVRCVYVCM